MAVIRSRRAAQERERKQRQERQRRAKAAQERKARAAREEKARKDREHRAKYTQDCVTIEEWLPKSECSADCGGGVEVARLKQRTVTTPQDQFKYGKACSTEQAQYFACNPQICDIDCSTVDLGNTLPRGGAATAWAAEVAEGECVFQLWERSDMGSSVSLKLIGETEAQGDDADATVSNSEDEPVMVDAAEAPQVVLGFRGCKLASTKPGANTAVGKVCLNGIDSFLKSKQTRVAALDDGAYAALRQLRVSGKYDDGKALTIIASKGVGPGEHGIEAPPVEPLTAAFSFSATISAQPPTPPEISRGWKEAGDDVQLEIKVAAGDNGAAITGYRIKARKLRGKHYKCPLVELPSCAEGGESPCFDTVVDNGMLEPVFKRFPLADKFEVHIQAQNEMGTSQSVKKKFATRAAKGISISECKVDYWTCQEDGVSGDRRYIEDDFECGLAAPPIPPCVMLPRKTWTGSLKCTGKKYWQECSPIMVKGDASCVKVSFPQKQVCAIAKGSGTCDNQGCSKPMFSAAKHCCCDTESDTQSDSPRCACSSEPCGEGLFESTNPQLNCRH